MKCRNCKRSIEDNSLFCNWCGTEQIRNKGDYYIPEPIKHKDYYSHRITHNGKKVTIKGKTRKEYFENAQIFKKGGSFLNDYPTLQKAIKNYIDSNSETLSPSTIRGYDSYSRNRFQDYMSCKLDAIDYQKMVNDEAKDVSPKSVKNAWGLVTPALEYAGFPVPAVNLPQVAAPDTDFLDHKQVKTFIQAIRGDDCEAAALLALHSLRSSELYHLTRDDISNNTIHVKGATVRNKDGKWVDKKTNKNRLSTRDIPVIIPRLLEVLPESGPIVTIKQETLRQHLKRICEANKLPVVSLHDLRRTYASLAAYLQLHEETTCVLGGWKPGSPIVHQIYIKVSNTAIKEDVSKMKKFLKMDTSRTAKIKEARK